MKSTTLILIMGVLLLSACTQEIPGILEPEPVFYVKCLLNGAPWKNCCDDCNDQWGWRSKRSIYSDYNEDSGFLEISVSNNCHGIDNGFRIASRQAFLNTKNDLFDNSYFANHAMGNDCNQYELLKQYPHFVILDSVSTTSVMGAFEATFANSCGDTVHLTQGEFHVIQ